MNLQALLENTEKFVLGTKKSCPKKPWLQKFATVNNGTNIHIVEYDLSSFTDLPDSTDWTSMLEEWLTKGAIVNVYVQKINPLAKEAVKKLSKNEKFTLNKFPVSNSNKLNFADYLVERHFTVFKNPDQLYIERRHFENSCPVFNTSYINHAEKDGRYWEALNTLGKIKENSTKI